MDEKGTKMRALKFILVVFLLTIAPATFAHVGSPGVIFEGKAGPYSITVNVNPPDVIPGVATAYIYVNDQAVNQVFLQPIYWNGAEKGAPKSDQAIQVNGTGAYTCRILVMQSGVTNMRITVIGSQGKGTAIIPVMAVVTAERGMSGSLSILIFSLLLLLVILMITIVGAGISSAVTIPGDAVKISAKKKIRTMIIAGVSIFLFFAGGTVWCYFFREHHKKSLYRPPLSHSSILWQGDQMAFKLNIDTTWLKANRKTVSYVIPDHGKLMHLFLIRENTDDVFAHLHPIRTDSVNYFSLLPDLPAGRYRVYGDIVKWNGFSETILDTVTIPGKSVPHQPAINKPLIQPDPDDTYLISNSVNKYKSPFTGKIATICGKPGTEMKLDNGFTALWQHEAGKPFDINTVYQLSFLIKDPSGKPVKLQPYMGMAGHAVIYKHDGTVYDHIHPVGNYTMASQQLIQNLVRNDKNQLSFPKGKIFIDSVDRLITRIKAMTEDQRNTYLNTGMKDMTMPGMNHEGMVSFPYSFPSPGNYRVWVQVKHDGKILNAAFDTVVE